MTTILLLLGAWALISILTALPVGRIIAARDRNYSRGYITAHDASRWPTSGTGVDL